MNNKKHIEDILYYLEKYHYENMILDDNEAKFIHDYIINLQFKIDKATKKADELRKYIYRELVDFNVCGSTEAHCLAKDLLDILKEADK